MGARAPAAQGLAAKPLLWEALCSPAPGEGCAQQHIVHRVRAERVEAERFPQGLAFHFFVKGVIVIHTYKSLLLLCGERWGLAPQSCFVYRHVSRYRPRRVGFVEVGGAGMMSRGPLAPQVQPKP